MVSEWMCQSQHAELSLWLISWFGRPVGQNYSVPDGGGCPERAWWRHVSPCFLSCHALYNPGGRLGTPTATPTPVLRAQPPCRAPYALSCWCAPSITPQAGGQEGQSQEWHAQRKLIVPVTSWLPLPSAVSRHCSL